MNRKIKRSGRHYVYIAECNDGTYYTGYTKDLKARLKSHNSGAGAKYLRGKAPVRLVYTREYRYYKNALRAERDIKKLPRVKKEGLVGAFQRGHFG